jgi:hypothetical protein
MFLIVSRFSILKFGVQQQRSRASALVNVDASRRYLVTLFAAALKGIAFLSFLSAG